MLCALTFIVVHSVTHTAEDQLRGSNLVACERGNIVRAYLIIDAGRNARQPVARQESAVDLFPIVDCSAIEDTGRPVGLPRAQADAYISDVAHDVGVADWNVTD